LHPKFTKLKRDVKLFPVKINHVINQSPPDDLDPQTKKISDRIKIVVDEIAKIDNELRLLEALVRAFPKPLIPVRWELDTLLFLAPPSF